MYARRYSPMNRAIARAVSHTVNNHYRYNKNSNSTSSNTNTSAGSLAIMFFILFLVLTFGFKYNAISNIFNTKWYCIKNIFV
jgi:hypothetical protein